MISFLFDYFTQNVRLRLCNSNIKSHDTKMNDEKVALNGRSREFHDFYDFMIFNMPHKTNNNEDD